MRLPGGTLICGRSGQAGGISHSAELQLPPRTPVFIQTERCLHQTCSGDRLLTRQPIPATMNISSSQPITHRHSASFMHAEKRRQAHTSTSTHIQARTYTCTHRHTHIYRHTLTQSLSSIFKYSHKIEKKNGGGLGEREESKGTSKMNVDRHACLIL